MNSPFNPPHVFGDGGAFGVGVGGSLPIGQAFLFPDLDEPHNAFPTAINYGGAIDVYYRAGDAHTGTDGVIKKYRSTNKGRSWTGPTLVYDDATEDARDMPVVEAPNGDIIGFITLHDGSAPSGFGTITSSDGGLTWGAYSALTPGDYGFTDWMFWYGRPLVIGSDIYAGGYGKDTATYTKHRAFLLKSTDNGGTWTKAGEINASTIGFGSAVNLNETAFYSTDGTNWVAFFRLDNTPIGMSTSSDGGATWTTGTFFSWGVSPRIVKLANGDAVLFIANRATPGKRITAFRSSDGFKSATKRVLFVELSQGDDFGYPAPLELGTNLLVPYYADPTTGGSAQTNLYFARRPTSFTAAKAYLADYENNAKQIDTDYASAAIANPSTTKPAGGRTYSMRINDTTADIFGFSTILNGGTSGAHYFGFNATALPNGATFRLVDNRDRIRFQVIGSNVSGTYTFRWYNGTSYQNFTGTPTFTLDTDYELGLIWNGTSLTLSVNGTQYGGGGIYSGTSANAEVLKISYNSGSGGGTGDDYHVQYESSYSAA